MNFILSSAIFGQLARFTSQRQVVKKLSGSILSSVAAFTLTTATAAPLLQHEGGTLYQQILTKPQAVISSTEDSDQGTAAPGFVAYYVFARHNGKLQIGPSKNNPTGWVKEDQTLPWYHRLNAEFAPLAGRSPVIFMKSQAAEENLLNSDDPAVPARAILNNVDHLDSNSNVIALEPNATIDRTGHFYLLPILDAHNSEPDYTGAMMMHLAGATMPDPKQKLPSPPPPFRAGLVFVIDTTTSMQPYIEQTRNAINDIVSQIKNAPLGNSFRFGLVGFRDQAGPQDRNLEYATKVFAKPDFSQPVDAVTQQIASVTQARASSAIFDEDPIAGLKTALSDIDWSSMQGRYIVLITDAGARDEHSHPQGSTHLSVEDMNRFASDHDTALFVIHLHTPSGKQFHDTSHAEQQYHSLSAFPNTSSLYYPVGNGSSNDLASAFAPVVRQLTQDLLAQATRISAPHPDHLSPQPRSDDPMAIVEQTILLRYIGQRDHSGLPPMVEGYAASTDPISNRTALRVNLLMRRDELSNLASSLETILEQGEQSQISPNLFFQRLQFAFASSARNPRALALNGDASQGNLGSLLPEYLNGLPYRSQIAGLTQERWNSLSAGEQDAILSNLRTLIQRYRMFEGEDGKWQSINGTNDANEQVYPVRLDDLP